MSLDWEDVSFAFDENNPILKASRFSIPSGSWTGIIGPNGGGKTTLLKILLGFLKPQKGHVRVLGVPPIEARPRIGYVPQALRSDRDFPITVEEIICLGCLARPEKRSDAKLWMERLGLMPHRKKTLKMLSGGTLQKTLLARALIAEPELLLLDEPTANIDPPSSAFILDFLQSLKGKKTILMVTHDVKTIVERVDLILSVQHEIRCYKPTEVCEHFAMGLYHTPLLDLPHNHWK
ncbi:MAG TPA: ATP-binding cassette domain-containing protein [Chlamydiales bacterium]|jgi:zinc transport system ATP-binding protein